MKKKCHAIIIKNNVETLPIISKSLNIPLPIVNLFYATNTKSHPIMKSASFKPSSQKINSHPKTWPRPAELSIEASMQSAFLLRWKGLMRCTGNRYRDIQTHKRRGNVCRSFPYLSAKDHKLDHLTCFTFWIKEEISAPDGCIALDWLRKKKMG